MKNNKLFGHILLASCLIIGTGCAGDSSEDLIDELFEDDSPASEEAGPPAVSIETVDQGGDEDTDPNGWFGALGDPISYNIDYSDTPTNARVYPNENNSALLFGPVVGTGQITNSENAREITIFGATDSAMHRTVAAYAMRSSVYPSGQAKIMLVVENTTSTMVCQSLMAVSFIHTSENEVYGLEFNKALTQYYIDGATFQSPTSYVASQCIPPNGISYTIHDAGQQSGYGSLDPLLLFNEVSGVTGGRGPNEIFVDNRVPVAGSVKPISYGISEDGNKVEILVRNENPTRVFYIQDTSVYLLDESGMPVGHVQALGGVIRLEPGEEGIVSFYQSQFAGSASTMRVVVDPRRP